jgi:hypothetical protein
LGAFFASPAISFNAINHFNNSTVFFFFSNFSPLNRHQSSEMLNVCESNENVYFGGNRGGNNVVDYSHLGFPYNIDRSEQETTTEL